jgi:hypothetical protein
MIKFSEHAKTSFLKSFLRILGFLCLLRSIGVAVGVLIIAEVIGIVEEFYA